MSRNDENLANVLCNYFGPQDNENGKKERNEGPVKTVKVINYYDFG